MKRIAAKLPTPWICVMERINVYSSMLWVATLGVLLLRDANKDRAENKSKML
jgi:hypothetical protein